MLSFFPLDVLDEIWDLNESVSEGFLTYSSICAQLLLEYAMNHLETLYLFLWSINTTVDAGILGNSS